MQNLAPRAHRPAPVLGRQENRAVRRRLYFAEARIHPRQDNHTQVDAG